MNIDASGVGPLGQRKRRKGEQKQGTCVYCGKFGDITDDHVFPRNLFLVKDDQMVTVPACDRCQQIKELGDRDLWIFSTLDMGGSQHPDMLEQLVKIYEYNERTAAWLERSFAEAEEVPLVTQAGLLIGTGLTFPFNQQRMLRTVGMMVRGAYYKETKHILPPETPVHAQYIPFHHTSSVLGQFGAIRQKDPVVKGNHIAFWSPYFPVDSDPVTSGWVFNFNDWVTFLGTSGNLAVNQQRMSVDTEYWGEIRKGAQKLLVLPEEPWPVVLESDREGRPIIPMSSLHIPSAYGPLILPVKETTSAWLYLPEPPSIPLALVKWLNGSMPVPTSVIGDMTAATWKEPRAVAAHRALRMAALSAS